MSRAGVAVTPGCYSGPVSGKYILAPYIILLVLEIGQCVVYCWTWTLNLKAQLLHAEVVCLTFYKMIRYYYATRCRLLTLVIQYSFGYVLAGLCEQIYINNLNTAHQSFTVLTVINIVAILFLPVGITHTRTSLDSWYLCFFRGYMAQCLKRETLPDTDGWLLMPARRV
jgi:hypothetical protein